MDVNYVNVHSSLEFFFSFVFCFTTKMMLLPGSLSKSLHVKHMMRNKKSLVQPEKAVMFS